MKPGKQGSDVPVVDAPRPPRAEEMSPRPAGRAATLLVLAVGLISISFAAPLIRLAQAPAVTVAAFRMGISVVLLSPFFWLTWRQRRADFTREPRLLLLSALSGIFLALHFGLWIQSLHETSVTSSVVLVTMNPVFLGIASPLLLKERISRRVVFAIVLGLVGAVVITLRWRTTELVSPQNLHGNLLALGGAVMYSGYLLLGRRVRRGISILSYVYAVYAVSALILLAGVAIFRQSLLGFTRLTYLYLVLLAVIPQLLGHTSFNWALKHMTAPVVSLVILGEPVGASLIAWLLLHQPPTIQEVAGGIMVLGAVALAATASSPLEGRGVR